MPRIFCLVALPYPMGALEAVWGDSAQHSRKTAANCWQNPASGSTVGWSTRSSLFHCDRGLRVTALSDRNGHYAASKGQDWRDQWNNHSRSARSPNCSPKRGPAAAKEKSLPKAAPPAAQPVSPPPEIAPPAAPLASPSPAIAPPSATPHTSTLALLLQTAEIPAETARLLCCHNPCPAEDVYFCPEDALPAFVTRIPALSSGPELWIAIHNHRPEPLRLHSGQNIGVLEVVTIANTPSSASQPGPVRQPPLVAPAAAAERPL